MARKQANHWGKAVDNDVNPWDSGGDYLWVSWGNLWRKRPFLLKTDKKRAAQGMSSSFYVKFK
ncbi:MAG: hypothetical protein AAF614_17730 [Chloroflexota bacterium]